MQAVSEELGSERDRVGVAAFVLSLRERGVFDISVLRALETVPRDAFAPRRFSDLARADMALPLAAGQTMTSPTVVALMLAALGVAPGHRVLEVGTGSGWVTALLVRLGASVRSYELRAVLRESAAARLRSGRFGEGAEVVAGDGLAHPADETRFDRIILNGALPKVPAHVTSLLAAGGRLVGAVSEGARPRLLTMVRDLSGSLSEERSGPIRIAPLAG